MTYLSTDLRIYRATEYKRFDAEGIERNEGVLRLKVVEGNRAQRKNLMYGRVGDIGNRSKETIEIR